MSKLSTSPFFLMENSLYQYHIQDGSAADTQQSTFFPFVEQNNKNDCNCLGKPMCAA